MIILKILAVWLILSVVAAWLLTRRNRHERRDRRNGGHA